MTTAVSSAPQNFYARFSGSPYLIAIGATCLLILAGSLIFPKESDVAVFLFDWSAKSFFGRIYPISIQNALYIMFAFGIADIWVRYKAAEREETYLHKELLPEGDEVLNINELGPIRRKIAALEAPEGAFLPQLLDEAILQLTNSKSLEHAVSIYTSMLELITHRLDLAYQTIRYLVWIIPTTGFIGTVIGIAISLEGLAGGANKIDIEKVAAGLKVSFYTTIIALTLSAILVLLQNIVQRREEGALNRAAQYTLQNLINRVYTGK
ncbi:MAG: MotA/TolQ/ExbB proton channel family protein [Xanthobacteraceae bacterium]|nr:MotA/TolQ/ExbB proton channel family protein [Xanthobacteraceae bacterium]